MHVAIVGNGVAGFTAALELRRLDPDCRITMISGESTYPYSRPALMYVFMGHMRYQETKPFEDRTWAEQRIELRRAWVTKVDTAAKRLELHEGEPLSYDKLLLATGSHSNTFGWPGQDLPGVQGLYGLMDLKALYDNVQGAKQAVIVGGGLIGVELAEMLHAVGVHVTFLVREASYWSNVLPAEESAMVTRLIRAAGIDLRLNTELAEIHAGPNGRVGWVTTKAGERIDCQLVGLTAGVRPNTQLCEGTPIETGRGILVDRHLETSVDGVYAAGDCAEIVTEGERPRPVGGEPERLRREGEGAPERPPEERARTLLQQVWYTGKAQGQCVAKSILGQPTEYDPGLWYNSAKFFDLEYQTYGFVHAEPQAGETRGWWEHPDGGLGLRIVAEDGAVTGFNAMGLRLRHRVCERWILERRSPAYVLEHLAEAGFDPEFARRHEPAIAAALAPQLGVEVTA